MIFHREALSAIRTQAGISRSQLADTVGISRAYMSQLENGDRDTPTAAVVCKLAEALGVPADALVVKPSVDTLMRELPLANRRDNAEKVAS